MSTSQPPPRRSARLVTQTTVAHFDNSPAAPKKRNNPYPNSFSTSEPPRKTSVSFPQVKTETMWRQPAIPPQKSYTYSTKSLEAARTREAEEAVGKLIQQDIKALKDLGVTDVSVKQVISKNFKNYKSRPSLTSERANELVSYTLSENEVPPGVLISGQPTIPSNVKIPAEKDSWRNTAQNMLTVADEPNFFWPVESVKVKRESTETIFAALQSLAPGAPPLETETETRSIAEIDAELDKFIGQVIKSPTIPKRALEPLAYPGNHLPWPVFWKQVPVYRETDIECIVDNCHYKPISLIIKAGIFTVPINKPVRFIYNEKTLDLTLEELLIANGINMYPCTHYRKVQGLLQKAGVHIRVDYADRLMDWQAVEESKGENELPPYEPIQLTTDTLPLMCIYPNLYMNRLGTKTQGAVIVDTSGDKEPLPGQTYLTTIYSEPLQFEQRRQLLIYYDAGVSIQRIAKHCKCAERSVKETLGTRILIDRYLIAKHLEENPEDLVSPTITEMMRPKSKIRRTHYVDLNKLVWKYFKDCQAAGQQINGKQLKDQAMRYAREMGLESFRGSEGWLDAFKRRHRIDLKAMTGYPVCYENEMYDEVEKECRELGVEPHHLHNNSIPSFLPHSTVNTAPDEFAASFFSTFNGFHHPQTLGQPQIEQTPSTNLQNMINSMMSSSSTSMDYSRPSTSSESTTSTQTVPAGENALLKRSCQIKIADKEISHAFDTLRTYILDNDQGAMGMLVQLQERLAVTAANIKNCQNGSSTSSNST